MIRRIITLGMIATVALILSAATVAAFLWGKRPVVWQVHRRERETWKAWLAQWRTNRTGL